MRIREENLILNKEKIWSVSSPEDVRNKMNRFRSDRSLQLINNFYKEVLTPHGFESEFMGAVKNSEKSNRKIQGTFLFLACSCIFAGFIGFYVSGLLLSTYYSPDDLKILQGISAVICLILAFGVLASFTSKKMKNSFDENKWLVGFMSQFLEKILPLLKDFQEDNSVMSEEEFTRRLLEALEGTGIGTEEFRTSSKF